MVCCGPFTVNNELSYEALKDFIQAAKRDQPHVLLLCGPFVSQNHEDVSSGDLRYRDPTTGHLKFMDYEGLFKEIMNYIWQGLGPESKTQVVIIPSTNEIIHTYPLPQPAMTANFGKLQVLRATNPAFIQLNDVSVGVINTDVIKDMCLNTCIKNPPNQEAKPKIDLVLQSMLQQRSFYPLYPGSPNTPIEWDQWNALAMPETPDILIAPSDLMLFAKNIEGCICVNPGTLYKGAVAGNYASITIDPLFLSEDMKQASGLLSNRASDRIRVDIVNI
jgi:DNA polymerase alpha subunit B